MTAIWLLFTDWESGEGEEITVLAPVESGGSFLLCAGHTAWPTFRGPSLLPPPSFFLLPLSFLPPCFCSFASCLFPKTCLWHSGSNRLFILQHECAF